MAKHQWHIEDHGGKVENLKQGQFDICKELGALGNQGSKGAEIRRIKCFQWSSNGALANTSR